MEQTKQTSDPKAGSSQKFFASTFVSFCPNCYGALLLQFTNKGRKRKAWDIADKEMKVDRIRNTLIPPSGSALIDSIILSTYVVKTCVGR